MKLALSVALGVSICMLLVVNPTTEQTTDGGGGGTENIIDPLPMVVCPAGAGKDVTCVFCQGEDGIVQKNLCCPYESGECCNDKLHCCPVGYWCAVISGEQRCVC